MIFDEIILINCSLDPLRNEELDRFSPIIIPIRKSLVADFRQVRCNYTLMIQDEESAEQESTPYIYLQVENSWFGYLELLQKSRIGIERSEGQFALRNITIHAFESESNPELCRPPSAENFAILGKNGVSDFVYCEFSEKVAIRGLSFINVFTLQIFTNITLVNCEFHSGVRISSSLTKLKIINCIGKFSFIEDTEIEYFETRDDSFLEFKSKRSSFVQFLTKFCDKHDSRQSAINPSMNRVSIKRIGSRKIIEA